MRCIWDPERHYCPSFGKCTPGQALICFAKEKVVFFPFSQSRLSVEGARVLREEFEKRVREAGG